MGALARPRPCSTAQPRRVGDVALRTGQLLLTPSWGELVYRDDLNKQPLIEVELSLPWIDLAWVLASLFREVGDTNVRLDTWLDHFGVDSIQRHHPVSDAYATAQVLQITLAHAARKGVETPVGLFELEKAHRHLYQSG